MKTRLLPLASSTPHNVFVEVLAALTMVSGHCLDMENETPISLDMRRASITGTRALVAEERRQAPLGLLIDAEVVNPAEVAGMCGRLAERLEGHARGDTGSKWVRTAGCRIPSEERR